MKVLIDTAEKTLVIFLDDQGIPANELKDFIIDNNLEAYKVNFSYNSDNKKIFQKDESGSLSEKHLEEHAKVWKEAIKKSIESPYKNIESPPIKPYILGKSDKDLMANRGLTPPTHSDYSFMELQNLYDGKPLIGSENKTRENKNENNLGAS